MKQYAAFFDLDHTILNTSSARILFRDAYRNGLIGKKEISVGSFTSMLRRLRLISTDRAISIWVRWFRGLSVEMMESLSRGWADELQQEVRAAMREEIKRHNTNGARTVMLSASLGFICNPLARQLEMEDVISSRLETADGHFTGRLVGRYCHGKEKLVRAREYCAAHGLAIEEAYYYADSGADLPVLEVVGTPVCVTPAPTLEKIAKRKGWLRLYPE